MIISISDNFKIRIKQITYCSYYFTDADEIDNDNPVKRDKEKAKAKTNNRNTKTIGNDEDKNEEDDDVDETENRKNNVKTKTRKKNVKSIKNDDQENEEKQDIDEDGDVDEIDGRRKKRYILHEEDQHNDDVEAAEDAEIKKPANSLAAKKTLAQGKKNYIFYYCATKFN